MQLILAIGFAVAALLCWSKAASAADLAGRATVIDGDTIGIHGQHIRNAAGGVRQGASAY